MTDHTTVRSRGLALALVIATAVTVTPLVAQTPAPANTRTRPDSMSANMSEAFTNMAPMMQQMMTAQLSATLTFYARPETADLLAQAAHNYYLALMRQGFTADQALAIVAAWKPTSAPAGR